MRKREKNRSKGQEEEEKGGIAREKSETEWRDTKID